MQQTLTNTKCRNSTLKSGQTGAQIATLLVMMTDLLVKYNAIETEWLTGSPFQAGIFSSTVIVDTLL